jgi:outer membrane receptor for ferrienterochelin and colicins
MRITPWITVPFTLCAVTQAARAEDDAIEGSAIDEVTDIKELSLSDLLDTKVDVASKKPQSTRETPGIVTVITRDDIVSSGARDLLDVLVLVPGFSPGVDVEGIVNLGIRGQWGHEGKILLLIDGQPMNELLYSTLQLANHYPLESIERIEVIRGPGSAVYGGFAELAVINIITRDAASYEGVAVAGGYGQLGNALGHANLTLSFGTTHTGVDGLSASGTVSLGHANSRGTYRDFAGDSFAMARNSARNPMLAKVAIAYRHLRLDGMIDDYSIQTRDGFGPVGPNASRQGFRAFHLDARYTLAVGKDITLTPRLGVIRQTPWEITDETSDLFYTKTVSRYTAGATLSYDPTKKINVLAGVETYSDRAHLNGDVMTGLQTMFGTSRSVAYDTVATYAQGLFNTKVVNVTFGARYENHSAVGGSLVPRVALTKVMGRFHAKLLAAQAFRAPGIENINLSGGSLDPEKTTVFESELGLKLTDHMFMAVNAYDITINKPIIYGFNQETNEEAYLNENRTGTRGLEVDYRIKYPRGHVGINYSFYTARGKNEVESYKVPDREDVLLAFPAHKVAMAGSLNLYKGLALNPSAVIYGERFGYMTGDADGNPVIGRQAPTALVNLYLLYRNLLVPGLDIGVGVYDVGNQHIHYVQPYNGGHAPLPGTGREVIFKLAYERKL